MSQSSKVIKEFGSLVINGAVIPAPIAASSSIANATAVTTVGTNTGTAGVGLSLIGDTTSVNQAATLMNNFVALQEDILALQVIMNLVLAALRTHKIILA